MSLEVRLMMKMIFNLKKYGELDLDKLNPLYKDYLKAFSKVTDAPSEFILTSLFATLGAAVSTSKWIQWGNKRVYPNMWVMLVGPSSKVRKSTALNIGLLPLTEMQKKYPKKNYLLPSEGSIMALLEVLNKEKHGVIKHSEIATLLENMSKGYNNNMKSTFTNFFDVPSVYKVHTKKDGELCLNEPIFGLASATTLEWLKKNISKNDVASGFLARFVYCYRESRTRNVRIPRDIESKQLNTIVSWYENLSKLEPKEIQLEKSFKLTYVKFVNEVESNISRLPDNTGIESLVNRLIVDYFLKLTIIECAVCGKTKAGSKIAERVINLILFYISQAMLVTEKLNITDNMKKQDIILHYLEEHRRCKASDIYKLFNNHINASQLKKIMVNLEYAGLVHTTKEGKAVFYQISEDSQSTANTQEIEEHIVES